jgi:CW-type Zinc Finger
MLDQHFNPTVAQQAISRVYRYGQTKPVFVYSMLTQGTMEEKVYGRCINKTAMALRIVDDTTIERCFTADELADLSDNRVWAQCDHCDKWRLLLGEATTANIPDEWDCTMNLDDKVNNHCGASEKSESWYDVGPEEKKGSAAMESPMRHNNPILDHILSVTAVGKRKTLVCDHHFREVMMETATLEDKLEQARQDLAASEPQAATVDAAVVVPAVASLLTEENQLSTKLASMSLGESNQTKKATTDKEADQSVSFVFKNATNAGSESM